MTIWGFVQTKGGAGKSTLAQGTAFSKAVKENFDSIGLIDFDPQGTLFKMWSKREATGLDIGSISFYSVFTTNEKIIEKELGSISQAHDLLILDVPGESLAKFYTKFACAISDVTLIPLRTSTKDEDAFIDNLLPTIKQIKRAKPNGNFKAIPTFVHPNASKKTVINYLNSVFDDQKAPFIRCIDTVFRSRTSVWDNFDRGGLNLYEFLHSVRDNRKQQEQAEKAVREIEEIAQLLIEES